MNLKKRFHEFEETARMTGGLAVQLQNKCVQAPRSLLCTKIKSAVDVTCQFRTGAMLVHLASAQCRWLGLAAQYLCQQQLPSSGLLPLAKLSGDLAAIPHAAIVGSVRHHTQPARQEEPHDLFTVNVVAMEVPAEAIVQSQPPPQPTTPPRLSQPLQPAHLADAAEVDMRYEAYRMALANFTPQLLHNAHEEPRMRAAFEAQVLAELGAAQKEQRRSELQMAQTCSVGAAMTVGRVLDLQAMWQRSLMQQLSTDFRKVGAFCWL
jgi:hypothetical protein